MERFFDKAHYIDRLIASNPGEADWLEVSRLLQEQSVYSYFFAQLADAKWIPFLRREGFFNNPPVPSQDSIGNQIHPFWPATQYLSRVTEHAPAEALSLMLSLVGSANLSIHFDLVNAALRLPGRLAAEWVEEELGWLKRQPYLDYPLPERFGELVRHLADNSALDVSFLLTETLLGLALDEPGDADTRGRVSTWDYDELVSRIVSTLVSHDPGRTLRVLERLLDLALRKEYSSAPERVLVDYSYIWRRDITSSASYSPAYRDVLATALLNAAQAYIEKDPQSLNEAIASLLSHEWDIYSRFAMHLALGSTPEHSHVRSALLTTYRFFDNYRVASEYNRLLSDSFGDLSPEDQSVLLSWIERGPKYAKDSRSGHSVAEADAARDEWQIALLSLVRTALPEHWKTRLNDLVQRFPLPPTASGDKQNHVLWGPTSTHSAQQLAALPINDLVAYLSGPIVFDAAVLSSSEGLGRQLADAVRQNAHRFGCEAAKFKGLEPVYIRHFLAGLRDAFVQGTPIPWEPVLDLCLWAVTQPRELPEPSPQSFEGDPHWGWARKAVADLAGVGVESKSLPLSLDLRNTLWSVLRPITDDPDPVAMAIASEQSEPAYIEAINSVRGEALHSVVKYARWVHRQVVDASATMGPQNGSDVVPEAFMLLEHHLKSDLSPAVRSVFGQWYPWLHQLDPQWTSKHLKLIFPQSQSLWAAAWNAYISLCPPFDVVFDALRDQYLRSVSEPDLCIEGLKDSGERLVEHLIMFYVRGKLSLDDVIFVTFYSNASVATRSYAIEFVGRTLSQTTDALPVPMAERIVHLWEQRLQRFKAEGVEGDEVEFSSFGGWFVSDLLETRWQLTQLQEVLAFNCLNKSQLRLVGDRLARMVPDYPAEVANCIRLLLNGVKDYYLVYRIKESLNSILRQLLQIAEEPVRLLAIEMVNDLGERGFWEFGELLETPVRGAVDHHA